MKTHRSIMKKINLLLIEDSEEDVILIEESLDACNADYINITNVSDGEEALNYLYKNEGYEDSITPDLILLDLNIPKINGLEVLETIKNDGKLNNIPVIVMTSSNLSSDIKESYSKNANSYIIKPIDFVEFKSVIKAFVDFWTKVVILPGLANRTFNY